MSWRDVPVCAVESRHRRVVLQPVPGWRVVLLMVEVGTTARQVLDNARELFPEATVEELRQVLVDAGDDVA